MEVKIIKILKINKSRMRLTLPKEAQAKLNAKEGDHVAFLEDDQPGIRVVKVKLDLTEKEKERLTR